ncbi:MAG: DUF1761 domain-containing protein [Hasllibacter sp.]
MGILSVFVAAVAAYAFGAVWYMALGRRWMAAAGVTEEDARGAGAMPYLVSFAMALLVAGMIRHVLATGGAHGAAGGALTGFGLGLFVAAPWVVNNVMFGMRDRALLWMDGAYPVIGCTIIGFVLGLFA